MKTRSEIQKQIRDLKREMKADGIRVVSCFNGGLTSLESSCNTRLFQLKSQLERTP